MREPVQNYQVGCLLLALGLIGCEQAPRAAPAQRRVSDTPVVRVEDLTWTELANQVAHGKTTVIIPVGGTEQSGPAIALGKHNFRVAVLADQIANELGDALVAPVVAYVPEGELSPPTEHMRFPGTITVPHEVFMDELASVSESFAAHGFKTVALIGDHGGYQTDLGTVANKLNSAWRNRNIRAVFVSDYYGASQGAYVRALEQHGFKPGEIGKHAGLADASLTLATAPGAVRRAALGAAAASAASAGASGDPRHATAELGALGTRLMIDAAVQQIRAAEISNR